MSYTLKERQIYGSSRLGSYTGEVNMIAAAVSGGNTTTTLGLRFYELSNHLGNVLTVISDNKIPLDNTGDGFVDAYQVQIVNVADYSPFGVQLDGRTISNGEYRYGFQGQERDDEIKGEGNSVNYKYRMHDPRVGRFFAVDPLAGKYPHNSPYAFSENKVIDHVELEGLEASATFWKFRVKQGSTQIEIYEFKKIESVFGGVTDYIMGPDKHWHRIPEKYLSQSLLNVDADVINSWENADAQFEWAEKVETITAFGDIAAPIVIGAAVSRIGRASKMSKANLKKATLAKNKAAGSKYEKAVFKDIKKTQPDAVEQITVKSNASGTKTRVDVMSTDKTGKIVLTEAKASATAPLTTNQKIAFPEIGKSGGVVVGKGKGNFKGGTKIEPTEVKIKRP